MHIIAAKAVCLKEAAEPSLHRLSTADRRERVAACRRAGRRRIPPGQRRHRQPPDARRRLLEGHHRQGRRGGARQGRHHRSTRTRSRSIRIRRWWRAASAIGTPAVTTRGMREAEMDTIAELITRALQAPDDDRALAMVRAEVETLCRKFPCTRNSRPEGPGSPKPCGRRRRAPPADARRSKRSSRRTDRLPVRCRTSSRAPGQVEMAAAVGAGLRARRRPARRGRAPAPARRSPISCPPS